MPKVLKNEKGEMGLIALFSLIFSSILFVSATVLNSTDNSSANITFNNTLLNISLNESIIDNLSIINNSQNTTINETLNLTIPIENALISNQSIITNETVNLTTPMDNLTSNDSLPKKLKNMSEIIEKNKNKLNNDTENYLKNIKDKKEVKDFIIKFRNSLDENKLVNVTLEKKIDRFKLTKIKGKVEDIEDLIEDSEIEFLELEQNVEILGENIPINIKKVKADSVWNLSKGSGVKVAVLDTGIGLHDDLAVTGGVSFVDNNYYDNSGHGTSVAGVIAALLNNEGLVGVAPSVDLYSVKIIQGSTGDLSNAIAGIEWVIENNMSIVSMSFGFNSYSQIFKEVLEEAYSNDILLVAASGNNGQDNVLYPARYDTVIAVGAVDENNNLASFSSYGFEQELVAPGVDINSTSLGNSYGLSSGTSMAAPHVAGVAALIKSFSNSLTNEQIRAKLRNDALDLGTAGKDDLYGYGLVQVNLKTSNFTIMNLSYFYEVFNITDFGLLNQTLWFWLNGTGTIDEVNFLPGYYLVNTNYQNGSRKSNIYNVTENGSIFILATNIEFRDFFSTDGGTTSDGIAWINDNITVKLTTNMGIVQVECFNVGPARQFNSFDYCYADTQTHMDQCDSDPDINCAQYTTCQVVGSSNIGTEKEIIDYTFATSNSSQGRIYTDCSSPGSSQQTSSSQTYYIVDRKAARCTNSSNYNISGWYGTNWIPIAQSTCSSGTKCTNSSNKTTESDYINPCIAVNTCTGTIQVITEDRNDNPIQNLLVSRDLVSNKTTNSVGVAEYNLSKDCGQSMEFKVYCSNSSSATLCGTKTAKLDVVNDYEGLLYDCSICSSSPDIQIDVDNVRTNKDTGQVTVNISLVSSFTASNVNITFKVQDDTGLIARESSQLFNINTGESFKSITQSITLNDKVDDFVHVYIDTTNKVSESNEKNNYALVPLFAKQLNAFLDVDVGYEKVNNEIVEYLKLFINNVSESQAQVIICVGKKCDNFNSLNQYTLNDKISPSFLKQQVYGFKKSQLTYHGSAVGSKPYNSIIGGFLNITDLKDVGNLTRARPYIVAYGTDIDGDIAAVKKLVSARNLFLNKDLLKEERTKVIDDFDSTGISVADLLRNPSNFPYYTQRNSDAFANVVSRILNNNNFEIAIRTVKTYNDNTTLRLKNINSDFSDNFRDTITNNSKPVVFAGGVFSDLFRWEENNGLAKQVIEDGRDSWEIEVTGGPLTECDTCPNYNYQQLVDYYWPALIAGVLKYSGQNKSDYVGHSNGCMVALDSLKNYSLTGKSNAGYYFDTNTGQYLITDLASVPVDIFIGLGCPALLNGSSRFIDKTKIYGDAAINSLSQRGFTHITSKNYGILVDFGAVIMWPFDPKISLNLMSYYKDLAKTNSGKIPGGGLSLNKVYLIAGDYSNVFIDTGINNDALVPIQDLISINKSLNYSNGELIIRQVRHDHMISDGSIQQYIRSRLRGD